MHTLVSLSKRWSSPSSVIIYSKDSSTKYQPGSTESVVDGDDQNNSTRSREYIVSTPAIEILIVARNITAQLFIGKGLIRCICECTGTVEC